MNAIDYDTLPNPTPQEADAMDPLELHTVLFRLNYGERNTPVAYWRRIHRNFARQALRELRYLTNRPTKRDYTTNPRTYNAYRGN